MKIYKCDKCGKTLAEYDCYKLKLKPLSQIRGYIEKDYPPYNSIFNKFNEGVHLCSDCLDALYNWIEYDV